MNVLDAVLLLAIALFAWSGYQRGLVVGALSLAGFVGGAVLGVWLMPFLVGGMERGAPETSLLAMVLVLVPAAAGQTAAGMAAWRLRDRMRWAPARWADGLGGAALNAVAVPLVAWIAASALVPTPSPGLNRAIQDSSVLQGVQDRMPAQAPSWFGSATSALREAGFPPVFDPFANQPTAEVPEPSGDSVTRAAVNAAQRSSVRVTAAAGFTTQEGSGFVFAEGLVMTNAHVVDGADAATVRTGGVGRPYRARVVLFDAEIDVAVLSVPSLPAPALSFAGDADRGAPAVVAGYPHGGSLDVQAASVAQRVQAQGRDIHGAEAVTRDIYAVRSTVRPGNSGGPLLTTGGEVYGMVFARSVTDDETGYVLTADQIRGHAERARQTQRDR